MTERQMETRHLTQPEQRALDDALRASTKAIEDGGNAVSPSTSRHTLPANIEELCRKGEFLKAAQTLATDKRWPLMTAWPLIKAWRASVVGQFDRP